VGSRRGQRLEDLLLALLLPEEDLRPLLALARPERLLLLGRLVDLLPDDAEPRPPRLADDLLLEDEVRDAMACSFGWIGVLVRGARTTRGHRAQSRTGHSPRCRPD
jgi:hypothetical protein